MSIRAMAQALYASQKEVARLEAELADSYPLEPEEIKDKLRQARGELHQMRSMVEGAKEQGRTVVRKF